MKAAGRKFLEAIGAGDPEAAFQRLTALQELAREHAEREAKIAADNVALESAERVRLVAQLIACGAEYPATAWEMNAEGKPDISMPVARLMSEPLESLRERVRIFKEARTAGAKSGVTPPAHTPEEGEKTFQTPHGSVVLSARELRMCAEHKPQVDPVVFATNKAIRAAAIAARSAGKGVI